MASPFSDTRPQQAENLIKVFRQLFLRGHFPAINYENVGAHRHENFLNHPQKNLRTNIFV